MHSFKQTTLKYTATRSNVTSTKGGPFTLNRMFKYMWIFKTPETKHSFNYNNPNGVDKVSGLYLEETGLF